ncbi:MAG TPA: hypothetical protein VJK72_03815 [Candidatus Nanoarchaeia archaeon]|nr:hypothetical protein [Candidatus Nanoarchaeia archaeon]
MASTTTTIVICPKTIPKIEGTYEGQFLFSFLKKYGGKCVIANECWSAFKYRIQKKYEARFDTEIANNKTAEFLARRRAWIIPENELLNKFGQDIIPPTDYSSEILTDKTKDIINRKWRIINYFITEEPSKYEGLKIKACTLQQFFDNSIETHREFTESFIREYPHKRDEME